VTTEDVTTEPAEELREPDPKEEQAPVEIDMEGLSDKARQAVDVINGLLDRMGFEAYIERIAEDERIEIDLTGADAGRVIGKRGQNLDALQFIVNKMVNRFPEERCHVILDVEGYKERRDDALRDMAHRLAEKASRTGKVISIDPMPARERRVIHLALSEVSGITTHSDGEGTERRVRIIPQSARRRSR
jgi:spoIIIJ-associated protein